MGCHFLLQCMRVKRESEVAQSCPTLSDPMDCSPPGSSVLGIFQARVLEWGAIDFSSPKASVVKHIYRKMKSRLPGCRSRNLSDLSLSDNWARDELSKLLSGSVKGHLLSCTVRPAAEPGRACSGHICWAPAMQKAVAAVRAPAVQSVCFFPSF